MRPNRVPTAYSDFISFLALKLKHWKYIGQVSRNEKILVARTIGAPAAFLHQGQARQRS
jgi:hypothetical protein